METNYQQVCDDLMLLIGRVKSCVLSIAEGQGLTRVQLLALYAIDQHGDMAMGQIATILMCDASNVTGIVDRLVAQDLLVRHEGAQDRRRKTLQLTDKGKQMVENLKAELPSQLGCSKFSAQESEVLHTIVGKLGV
jgi:DNA-binding MarR family transcriptional regulator